MSAAEVAPTRLGPFPARVLGSDRLGGLALVRLSLDPRTALGGPGQFHMLLNPAGRDYLPRPVGLIQLDDGGVGVLVDAASAAGDMAGPLLQVLGPLGTGFDLAAVTSATTLLVAAGFGITVLPAIVTKHPQIRLLAGFRQADHVAALKLVERADHDEPAVAPDTVLGALASALATGRYQQVLAAGPLGLGRAVAGLCLEHGVASQIAVEAPMACGFGACNGCAIELGGVWLRCCIEGPVVAGARLVA